MSIKYGQSITWTMPNGDRTTITVNGHDTMEEARREAIAFAKDEGWTYPRWWQWWRWHDTRSKL